MTSPDKEYGHEEYWDKVFTIAKKRIKAVAPGLSNQLIIHTARVIAEEVSRITINQNAAS